MGIPVKTKLVRDSKRIALVVDRMEEQGAEPQVLAALTNMHDSACWYLIDIRLRSRPVANEYSGSGRAEDFLAEFVSETPEELAIAKGMLREFEERDGGRLLWCTYLGMVVGALSVDGYMPVSSESFYKPLYHSEEKGLQLLEGIRAFWEQYDGKIEDAAIDNIHAQPSESDVLHAVIRHQNFRERNNSGITSLEP
jgi:hypothetical protein